MYLPLGVFAVAIATVILPSLSRKHSDESLEQFKETLDWGLRCILLIALPASVALITLAEPMVITLYQRGEFGTDSVFADLSCTTSLCLGVVSIYGY